MALIDLNNCFPEAADGTRAPLPKQQHFLNSALDAKGPKYIRYCGGIGSGKTMIGCITVLSWAVMYPGDYLVCRQFFPELKITTLKTFLELCPPELIHEYRVADGIVRIKAAGGKISNVIFRQLEEPDKLRSLNLSGFYIDESSQVSEAAFMLLQGRLRGPGLRKGILTTNPNGHDWQYQWFIRQDMFKSQESKKQYLSIKAPSTENHHLPDGYVQSMMETWSEDRIQREIMGSEDAFEGMVYHEFRRDIHVVQPFVIPDQWTRIIGIDHGYRNPAAWVWGAVDYDENIYIYREYYEREHLIEEIVKGRKGGNPGVLAAMKRGERTEPIEQARIDPSVRAARGTGLSDWDAYVENLPVGFPLMPANNEKTAGIDRVKSYLKLNPRTGKPRLYIFSSCTNLIEELAQYRYKELTTNQQGKQNEKEEPMKVNDHACDALRYLVMSRPEPPKEENNVWEKLNYNSLEGSLYRELDGKKNPKPTSDPFGF
jgi:PBSX family phage terminase large subunit